MAGGEKTKLIITRIYFAYLGTVIKEKDEISSSNFSRKTREYICVPNS